MAKPELKPCPFCGATPELRCTSSSQGNGESFKFARVYKLWCQNCGCTRGENITVRFDYTPTIGVYANETELNKAVERWNQRVPEVQHDS